MIQNFYWKLQQHPFVLIRNYPFKHCYIFLYITIFIWVVWFTCFRIWFEIIIDIKYLKVMQFGLFIQICQHVLLSLKLDNVTKIFWLILKCEVIIICFKRFLLKWGFWFPHKIFCFLRNMFTWNWKIIFKDCMGSYSRCTIKNVQFKLVSIILFEIVVYWFLWFKLSNFVLNISSDDDHPNQVQRNLSS